MPPEITPGPRSTAGLMALAGAPPGVAAGTSPSPPEPLAASLFAAFLAQSSPPGVTAAVPKAAATQTLAAGQKQTPLETQALLKPKTMDTLPMLSFPPAQKAIAKASELPFPQTAKHLKTAEDQKSAEDQKTAEDQKAADKTPAPSVPGLVPVVTGQIALPPVLLAASGQATPAASVTAPVAAPAQVIPAAPPAQAASEQAVPQQSTPVSRSPWNTSALVPASAAAPDQPAPAQSGLPLPRTWALTAPLQTVPQAPALPAASEEAPQPTAAGMTASKPAAATPASAAAARPLPSLPSPVSAAPQAPVAAPLQAGPQEGVPAASLPAAPAALLNTTVPAPVLTFAAAAAVPLPSETLKPIPAKTAGKFSPPALKPAGENADTYTGTASGQAARVSPKVSVPAAGQQPAPEKHTEAQKPVPTTGDGTNRVPTFSPAAPAETAKAETVKAEAKPLSAGERAEVVRQAAEVVQGMPLPAKPGAPEQMSVQLHPKDWGSLQVSVTVAPSQAAGAAKTVTAHIVAETPQVKAALQSGTGALHQALRASGLHLDHLTVSVKAPEKAVEVKPAAQSASAEFSSGQRQSDPLEQSRSFGQPGTDTGGFGANPFGAGGSQNNRQGQHSPAFLPAAPDLEQDEEITYAPLRPASGRIDTRA